MYGFHADFWKLTYDLFYRKPFRRAPGAHRFRDESLAYTMTSLWPSSATSYPTKPRCVLCQQDICVCPRPPVWFLISFKIIMRPGWIGLLLAAVKSSSGQIPKSVAFGEWFLSFPYNYTLLIDELISPPTPPPPNQELKPLPSGSIYLPRGPGVREECCGEGGLGIIPDSVNAQHRPCPDPPSLPAVLKAAHLG